MITSRERESLRAIYAEVYAALAEMTRERTSSARFDEAMRTVKTLKFSTVERLLDALDTADQDLARVRGERDAATRRAETAEEAARGAIPYNRLIHVEAAQVFEEARAECFAVGRHAGQRYGADEYVAHLSEVRRVLADHGHHGALGVAAWLHDVCEDTSTTLDEIRSRFGPAVCHLVCAVTGEGKDRWERLEDVLDRLPTFPDAVNLKLADRIANVERSRLDERMLAIYRAEQPAIESALAGLGDERMWSRLRAALAEPRECGDERYRARHDHSRRSP